MGPEHFIKPDGFSLKNGLLFLFPFHFKGILVSFYGFTRSHLRFLNTLLSRPKWEPLALVLPAFSCFLRLFSWWNPGVGGSSDHFGCFLKWSEVSRLSLDSPFHLLGVRAGLSPSLHVPLGSRATVPLGETGAAGMPVVCLALPLQHKADCLCLF